MDANPATDVDVSKAKDTLVVMNRLRDENYAPYCLDCRRMERMRQVRPYQWECPCGASHDETQVLR